MTTQEFFDLILPESGIYYLAIFREGYKAPYHRAYSDLETMAFEVAKYSSKEDLSVYHACASYERAVIEVGDRKRYRVRENWDRAKAFWLDLDCGEEKHAKGEGYRTKKDALIAVFKFADKLGWPRPMIVDSGNGLHAYWPLTKAITADKWVRVAGALKAALAYCKVIADPSRTADFASILRPAGSLNRKGGGAKSVVVKHPGTPTDPAVLAATLLSFTKKHSIKPVKETNRKVNSTLNDDLTSHLQKFPDLPVDANKVADRCAQVAAMRDTEGDVSYDHWRGVIGILKHCEGGEALAESWSARREETGHTQLDWDIRYESWNAGPTTCEFFERNDPDRCAGCPMKDKIRTPLVLGRVEPENKPFVEEVVTEEGQQIEVEVPALVQGYVWSNGVLARTMKDKDDNPLVFPFSNILFYLTTRIRTEDGTYRVGVRMHLPNHKVRDFEMTTESLASQTDMLRSLARYELTQSNHKDAGTHMAAYLRDQLEDLKRRVDEVNTLTSFGWREDMSGFLIGDRLYHKDGSVRNVLVGGHAAKYKTALPEPKGSVDLYASALNWLYNREGAEHWQYAVCSGWGSVLTPFGEDLYRGLLVALSGGDSGKGKTTVCYASLYAFGNADDMALKSDKGYTDNALWSTMGAFNNIPILLDELTSMDPAKFSEAAYGVSRGEEKVRMTSRGGAVTFAKNSTWAMAPFVTGNRDFHGLLAQNQANSQAEAVRLIQITIDRYPVVKLDDDPHREADLVQSAVDTLKASRGAAGDALVRYIVTHQRQVADEVRATMNRLASVLPAAKYRFYRNHGACTLVAARIAKDLGIVDFDLDRLFNFTVNLLTDLAETVSVTNTVTIEDAFNRMMTELSNRIVVTQEFRMRANGTKGAETPRNHIHGTVAGRMVLGSSADKTHAGWLCVSQMDARQWCLANRVDFNAMINDLDQRGAMIKRSEKLVLTRGTDLGFSGQVRCFVVDFTKLSGNTLSLVSNNDNAGLAVEESAHVS